MKKFLLISCLWGLALVPAYSQIDIPSGLEQAINRAIEKSVSIKNHQYEIDKLKIQRNDILYKYIPKIEGKAFYAYSESDIVIDLPTKTTILGMKLFEGKTNLDSNFQVFNAGLTAKVPIFTGLQIPNGSKAVKHKTEGTQYLLEAEKDVIIKEVINSFDNIHLLNEAEKLIKESEIRLSKESERINKAIDLGLAIPYDRDKIKYASLELDSKKIEIEGKRKVLFQKLNYLTDYSNEEILNIEYELVPFIILDDNITSENKQELRALESFKTALEYILRKERGSYLPTIGAFAKTSYSTLFDTDSKSSYKIFNQNRDVNLKMNEFTIQPNWMVGVALKWEIFSGFERKHKIDEAKINIAQMQSKIDDTKEKLELLLNYNYANYNVLLQKVSIVNQQEKIAQNNLNIATKQYNQGLISITERLESENDVYKASLNKVNTLIEQRLSAIETITTTGQLTQYISKTTN